MAQPTIKGTGHGKPVMPYGSDGSNWYALLVSALGKLQVEIDASVLPTDAATETTLASLLTSLQSLQNLVGALNDVGLDELRVRASDGDKIFSFESVLAEHEAGNMIGANGYLDSDAVPSNKIWVVTNISVRNTVKPLTKVAFLLVHDAANYAFYEKVVAVGTAERVAWSGHLYLDYQDFLRIYFTGGADGDACEIDITGYVMNAP